MYLKHLPLFLLWYMHIKKEGYLPRHPIFINLKSNTMKNTMQIYDFYAIQHNIGTENYL